MHTKPILTILFVCILLCIVQSVNALENVSFVSQEPDYLPGDIVSINVLIEFSNNDTNETNTNESNTNEMITNETATVITFQVKDPAGKTFLVKTYLFNISNLENITIQFLLANNSLLGEYVFYLSIFPNNDKMNTLVNGSFSVKEKIKEPGNNDPYIPVPIIGFSLFGVGLFTIIWMDDRGRYLLVSLFLLPLYTRIKPDIEQDVNQRNNRGRIFQHIKENPGTSMTQIRISVETGNGTTVHHLKVLENERKIVRRGKNFFVKGATLPIYNGMKRGLKLREEAIINYLLENGTAIEKSLSTVLQVRQSTINRELMKLLNLHIVERKKDQNRFIYSLTEKYIDWYNNFVETTLKSEQNICPHCGRIVPMKGALFCPFCSKNIRQRSIIK